MRVCRSGCPEVNLSRESPALAHSLHLNFDDAWQNDLVGMDTIDLREWGPQLRFSAPARLIEQFQAERISGLPPFVLYGSGDFHHLTALWIRRMARPVVVVSFDNHPDWDVRPPKWACGGWVNRALELAHVRKVSVWGCGNFECWWPSQIFGNRRAEREGRLELYPWADQRPAAQQGRRGAIFRATWRDEFGRFVAELAGANVYVTVDLDCLQLSDAITNWESGRFTVEDVAWALGELRRGSRVVAGDLCGAFSPPAYARRKQRFVAWMDHPKSPPWELQHARAINHTALEKLWPVLTEGDEHDAYRDQERADD